MTKVSIVIVCMNNLKNLYPCLDSIRDHTSLAHETLVVAYLFSEENLGKLRQDYPWVKVVESREIRGFSENNNLALRQAAGEDCFVLNDDTKFDTPVIDRLVESLEKTPGASVMSPRLLYADGRTQSCGRPKMTTGTYLRSRFRLWHERGCKSIYMDQTGIFQTYNVVGAAFLIKTDVFRALGFFDERYFFCPEDIALSTKANELGYKCYVDESIHLYHLEGGTGGTASRLYPATYPAGVKGSLIFYSNGSGLKRAGLTGFITVESILKYTYWKLLSLGNRDPGGLRAASYAHALYAIYSNKTPKELFIRYYQRIQAGR